MTNKKNVIYLFTFTKLWDDVAKYLQKENNWQPVLYVGSYTHLMPIHESILGNVCHYEVHDARHGVAPDHIPGFKKKSLDATLLESYAQEQSIIYEMMTRFIPDQTSSGYDARRMFYWDIIRIWEGLFDLFKPDMIIAASFPHRVFDYVAYIACKNHGIPYVSLDRTALPHLDYGSVSITDSSAPFRIEMERLKKSDEILALSEKTISYQERLRKSYDKGRPVHQSMSGYFSERRLNSKNSISNKIMSLLPQETHNFIRLLKLALKGRLFIKMDTLFHPVEPVDEYSKKMAPVTPLKVEFDHLRTISRMRRAITWYESEMEEVDFDTPFIYFSANFQPERSTVPDGGYFHDFHLVLDILEQATPKHWNIYYKEHPHSFHRPVKRDNPRSVRFYKRLLHVCPRLRFLSQTGDPFKLIDRAQAVALVRGTAAWEAVTRDTPVLSFGNAWYECCPGIYPVKSVEECVQAFKTITLDYKVDQKELQIFIKAVENVGVDLQYYFKDLVRCRSTFGGGKEDSSEVSASLEGDEYDALIAKISDELINGVAHYFSYR